MIDPRSLSPIEIRRVAARMRGGRLGRLLDSTLLKPQAVGKQIDSLVDEAVHLGAHVCVNESRVERAVKRLESYKGQYDRKILIASVVGFPLGACTTEMKVIGTKAALEMGADEIDMVGNIGLLKENANNWYANDIDAVASTIADFNSKNGDVRGLKVIIETCYLTNKEKEFAAATSAQIGLKHNIPIFVKTSTGFGQPAVGIPSGATVDDVLLIRKTIGDYNAETNPVGVKASGGVKNATDAIRMIIAGGGFNDNLEPVRCQPCAVRIGTSSAGNIMHDFEEIFGSQSWLQS